MKLIITLFSYTYTRFSQMTTVLRCNCDPSDLTGFKEKKWWWWRWWWWSCIISTANNDVMSERPPWEMGGILSEWVGGKRKWEESLFFSFSRFEWWVLHSTLLLLLLLTHIQTDGMRRERRCALIALKWGAAGHTQIRESVAAKATNTVAYLALFAVYSSISRFLRWWGCLYCVIIRTQLDIIDPSYPILLILWLTSSGHYVELDG